MTVEQIKIDDVIFNQYLSFLLISSRIRNGQKNSEIDTSCMFLLLLNPCSHLIIHVLGDIVSENLI